QAPLPSQVQEPLEGQTNANPFKVVEPPTPRVTEEGLMPAAHAIYSTGQEKLRDHCPYLLIWTTRPKMKSPSSESQVTRPLCFSRGLRREFERSSTDAFGWARRSASVRRSSTAV